MALKRPSYRDAVRWIAYNDETAEESLVKIGEFISTMLVADIFGTTPEKVAADVHKARFPDRVPDQ